MHIKICGLTNLDDALAALDAGADYLGFNFYPKSPRCIMPEECARIQAAIRDTRYAIRTVGIFVNRSPADIAAVLDDCGLNLAQLHGDERPEQLTALRGRMYKAFRGTADDADLAAFAKISPGAPTLLIDAHNPHAYGGTGQVADWQAARALAQKYPLFLAGGLTPDNVAQAIAQVKPWGVDVASGVEASPGRKDHRKIRAFIQAVWECGGVEAIPPLPHTPTHSASRSQSEVA